MDLQVVIKSAASAISRGGACASSRHGHALTFYVMQGGRASGQFINEFADSAEPAGGAEALQDVIASAFSFRNLCAPLISFLTSTFVARSQYILLQKWHLKIETPHCLISDQNYSIRHSDSFDLTLARQVGVSPFPKD